MRIKVYVGCAVDGHNGVYTPTVFAQRYPSFVLPGSLEILLAGPDAEDYTETSADDFICNSGDVVFEYNNDGDILEYQLIDVDSLTVGQIQELAKSIDDRDLFENQFGYCHIQQLGENLLCRVHVANVGIIGADCFFEMDNYFSIDENLQQFIEHEIEPALRAEFEEGHEIYTLPAFWASYLINGDCSGMDDSEIAEVDAFLSDKGPCVGCSDDTEEFSWRNDATKLGGSTKEFYFQKVEASND